MRKWLDAAEVNTGRQREFDYLKGIFMLLIFMIHAFQGTLSPEDGLIQGIYIFNSMSGAAIFIFVMGFGTAYSRQATPRGFAISGARLVLYQYLNNLAYIAALLLPYPLIKAALTPEGSETLQMLLNIYIQYTNIFFISGIIYLVFALLKKLNVPVAAWAILGAAVSLAAPRVFGMPLNVPVLGYLAQLLIGDAPHVSFTPLYYLPYGLFGAAFGQLFRRVRDKRSFYLRILPLCGAIIVLWWALVFRQYGTSLAALRKPMGQGYILPNLWHVAASIAHILAMAALIWFIIDRAGAGEPVSPAAKQLLYYSRHISKYYALHILPYNVAFGLHGYSPFEHWQCWLLVPMCMAVTEGMVRGYNHICDSWRQKKGAQAHV